MMRPIHHPVPLLLHCLSSFLPLESQRQSLIQKQIPLHAIIHTQPLSHMHTRINTTQAGAGGVLGVGTGDAGTAFVRAD